MVFVTGSGDLLSLTGGAETIADSGSGNTYIIPIAGKGADTFTGNILTQGDTLDFKSALAATNWNGAAATLPNYLTVSSTAAGAVVSLAAASGGAGTAIATIAGATGLTYSTLLAHSIT